MATKQVCVMHGDCLDDCVKAAWNAATLAERDACAKVCEDFGKTLEVDTGQNFAEEIRARTE